MRGSGVIVDELWPVIGRESERMRVWPVVVGGLERKRMWEIVVGECERVEEGESKEVSQSLEMADRSTVFVNQRVSKERKATSRGS
jgi:hypothetical protein